jgi:hypothetical protein
MTSVFYGTEKNYVDVTGLCLDQLDANGTFIVPAGDGERNQLFGDPVHSVVKHVCLRRQDATADLILPLGWSFAVQDLDTRKRRYKLSIASMFRDGAFYLKEWIEFHLLVGVEHFYLGNHYSIDNYMPILQPYIERGLLELVHVPETVQTEFEYDVHVPFMNRAMQAMKYRTEWLALIDVDEFITPIFNEPVAQSPYAEQVYNTLDSMRRSVPDLGGVALNWVCYGNAGVRKLHNNEFIMERCNRRSPLADPLNNHLKCIVLAQHVTEYHVHNCSYDEYYKTYDMSGGVKMAAAVSARPYVDRLRITHYKMADLFHYHWTKMPFYADYILQDNWLPDRWLTLKKQSDCSRHNDEEDNYMVQFANLLRQRGVGDLQHHADDREYSDNLSIKYGRHGAMRDITKSVAEQCTEDGRITIEPGDVERSHKFGDPNPGVLKHVFVARDAQIRVYGPDERIEIDM